MSPEKQIKSFGGLFLVIDGQIRPMIRATAAYHASIYATNLMNEAVEQQLELVRDAQLVVISQTEQTNITSVTLDMMCIKQIKTGITERILQELSSEETEIVNKLWPYLDISPIASQEDVKKYPRRPPPPGFPLLFHKNLL